MRTILILFALCSFAQAHAVTWKRHVLSEARNNNRVLLLVIDEPINARLLPRVVLRQSFPRNELARAKSRAQHLKPASDILTPTDNPLWPIDHPWTDQDEKDYDTWIHKIADVNFLVGGGVSVDCADYALALRWIYAHDHHLPAGQTLAAGKGLFGSWQSTVDWDKLPTDSDWKKDERFKAALRYLLNTTFTHTVFTDSYPVAITSDYVTPGTIFLTLDGDSGHTRTIFSIGPSDQCQQSPDCILIIWGNEPAAEEGYITEFSPTRLNPDEGGFLRFRWPEPTPSGWQLRAPEQMRGYSSEQYAWSEDEYLNLISERLSLWQTPEAKMKVTGDFTTHLLMERLLVTYQGYVVCSLVPCTPQDPIYVNYSTPVRDHAIARSIQSFQWALRNVDPRSQAAQDFKAHYNFPMFNGAPFTVFDLLTTDINTQFNSEPSTDFFTRWGISALDNFPRTQALVDLANFVWFSRERLINQAQEVCFANGSPTPNCDIRDPNVQLLATDRLDQGLRLLRQTYLDIYNKLTSAEQAKADLILQQRHDASGYCASNPDLSCSLYDYFRGPVDHWGAMTSSPDSPRQRRYGF